MKTTWPSFAGLVLVFGCGGASAEKPANTAGAGAGGSTPSPTAGSGGASAGGSLQGGASTGGAGSAAAGSSGAGTGTGGNAAAAGSSAGGGAGMAGASGSGGTAGTGTAGGASKAFACPAGPFDLPALGVTATRVPGVPPADAFNNNNADFTNIEGDVWIGDALYVSELNPGKAAPNMPPPARILKITADGQVSIAVPADSGSNGLAVNDAGELFAALHKDGSISKFNLATGMATPVASMFMGKRFDSPNDLTIHKNGTIYFTDPDWQSPTPKPQTATRAYRVPPGGVPQAIEDLSQPNGITLSKNQDFLYVGGNQLKKYPVMPDGSLGVGATFVPNVMTDGMALDCADNLYVTAGGVKVYSPAGVVLGMVAVPELGSVTNVAFGGADHKTLYISGQGTGTQKGLFKVAMNVPGFPY